MQAGLFSADPRHPVARRRRGARVAVSRQARRRVSARPGKSSSPGWRAGPRCCAALGEVAASRPDLFGAPARLGNLYDYWLATRDDLPAPEMLRLVLRAFGPIWPGRLSLAGVPLGDCGRHPAVPGDGLVPFHKLSQWLVYSLIEPLADAGFTITEIDGLTGLAEYRNGGLFLDCGVIVAARPGPAAPHARPVRGAKSSNGAP